MRRSTKGIKNIALLWCFVGLETYIRFEDEDLESCYRFIDLLRSQGSALVHGSAYRISSSGGVQAGS
jgi:hypothetical protein